MQETAEIVNCGSVVEHPICPSCEDEWRSKMPLFNGMRTMTCPTCRQPERERTVASLQREVIRLNQPREREPVEICVQRIFNRIASLYSVEEATTVRPAVLSMIIDVALLELGRPVSTATTARARPARPPIVPCASGRDCRTRSRVSTRTKTHLKCRRCQDVACCRTCRFCQPCTNIMDNSE